MSSREGTCFFCNRDNLDCYILSLCSHRICTLCLYERIFTNHIHEFQGQDKIEIKCKCEIGYTNQKYEDIIQLFVKKDKLEEKEDCENTSENANVEINGCECSNNENKLGKLFAEYFCLDCLKFVCKECKDDIKNMHLQHRVIPTKHLIKSIKDNIRNLSLDCKTLEDFNKRYKNLSENLGETIDVNFNNTIKYLDDLMDCIANLKEEYIKQYQKELETYLKTMKIIKIFYLNYYNDKNKEFKNVDLKKCNIYKLKYLNNISYELKDVQMEHSKLFDKKILKIKNNVEELRNSELMKKLLNCNFKFAKIKKGYKIGQSFQAHKKFINALVLAYHTNKIITSSYDYHMKVWDPISTKKELQNDKKKINNLYALQNGKILASSGKDLLFFEYNSKDEKYNCCQSITNHEKNVLALGELEDGILLSGAADKRIILWKENPNNKFYEPRQQIETEKEIQNILALNDFKIAYSGDDDGIITILNTEITLNENKKLVSNKYSQICELKKVTGKINCMCKLNQDYFVAGGGLSKENKIDNNIYIWKPDGNKYCSSQIIVNAHEGDVNCIILLRDGRFASSSRDRTIKIWKVDKSEINTEIKYIQCQLLDDFKHGLFKLIQLPDDRIVSVSSDNALVFWNNTDGIL